MKQLLTTRKKTTYKNKVVHVYPCTKKIKAKNKTKNRKQNNTENNRSQTKNTSNLYKHHTARKKR